ncbi:MAG: hypothetical protein ACR2MQ_06790 [Gemmatimonadaceae bacterium]
MKAPQNLISCLFTCAFTALALGLMVTPVHAQSSRDRAPARDTAPVVTFSREVFQYHPDGRRDPFVSLIKSSEIRPVITDLRLTTVAYDATGNNSVAVLRDLGTKEQYRVKVGTPLGRMRVVRIDQKAVTFALEEFGFSRQQTLAMGDSTNMRTP